MLAAKKDMDSDPLPVQMQSPCESINNREYQPVRVDCRAREFGSISECLSSKAHLCQHACTLEGIYVCMHPMRLEIIARSVRAA